MLVVRDADHARHIIEKHLMVRYKRNPTEMARFTELLTRINNLTEDDLDLIEDRYDSHRVGRFNHSINSPPPDSVGK